MLQTHNMSTSFCITIDMEFSGLSYERVLSSRREFGPNMLTRRRRKSLMSSFLNNFGDPMIKVLLVALGIQVVFLLQSAQILETVGIAAAILIAVIVSTLSEHGSEKAFERLSQLASSIDVRVRRDSKTVVLPVCEVVVGDIVLVGMGDKIPADGVILSGSLEVDQSLLNGESKEAKKFVAESRVEGFLNPQLLFSGTVVTNGEAVMRVTAVGDKTQYGKIASELQDATPDSPLKVKLRKLAKMISVIGYVGAGLVALSYMFSIFVLQGQEITFQHMINIATLVVAVIVMAVPEGLPMMIAVVLSSNMKHMLKDNVLIRKMGGIETAGSMNILFTDKTGTLTYGKLEVVGVVDATGRYIEVERLDKGSDLARKLSVSLRYNTSAEITGGGKAIGGNSTDRILLEFAQILPKPEKFHKIGQELFNSTSKFMSTTLSDGRVLKKGAPEVILGGITSSSIYTTIKQLSEQAIRMIACSIDGKLVGLIAIRDRVRAEAKTSIKQLDQAGIQTVMITGDAEATARAVARETGILSGDDVVLTSEQIARMTDAELMRILPKLRVVARALPSDKSRLVRIAQELNLVSGMTGDGVNDAPALKKADIGFSMGSGTEVAKEAGDIVIMDDNIGSIVKAVSYGRTIFKSIRKFLIFKLIINFCAMAICIVAPILHVDTPITVIQMLWINLVMDTLAGLAFGGEKPRKSYMMEPPKRRDEQIINRYMWQQILFGSIFTATVSLLFLVNPVIQGHFEIKGAAYAMTAFFMFFMFLNIFNSFNTRTHEVNPISYLSLNKPFVIIMATVSIVQIIMIFFGGSVFRTVPLDIADFAIVMLLALVVIPVDMIRKMVVNRKGRVVGT